MVSKSDPWILIVGLPAIVVGLAACDDAWRSKPPHPMAVPRDQPTMVPTTTPSAGPRIGAIARRVPIRSQPSPVGSLLGFLTAGTTVSRSENAVGRDGCPEGWYSVSPRGYLCLDAQTTIDEHHPTLLARGLLANRESPLPYPYAVARRSLSLFEPDPDHHDGVRERGRLGVGSSFAIVGSWQTLDNYDQRQTLAMLTLGVFVPTRDIEPIRLDNPAGAAIDLSGRRLPLGLSLTPKTPFYRFTDSKPMAQGLLDAGKPIALTAKSRAFDRERYLLSTDDTYVAERDVKVVRQRQEFPDFVTPSMHWVDVDLAQGLVVMYVGEQPSYVTQTRTHPNNAMQHGTAWVKAKHITDLTSNLPRTEKGRANYDSPWIVELDSGLALRASIGATTAESSPTPRTLELYPEDAARLFRFVQPSVPEGWHAVMAQDARHEGSPVVLR
jgi:hypothetical protein